MRRNQIQYSYVMPYGRLPMIGGNVYLETGKTVAKKAIPMLAKLWSKLSDEQKAQVITAGVTLGAKGAKKLGSVVRSGVQSLSQKAEDKLSRLCSQIPYTNGIIIPTSTNNRGLVQFCYGNDITGMPVQHRNARLSS